MRTERGRFAAGNPGGPGRPRKETEQGYADAMRDAITPADLCDVLKSMVRRAKGGDVAATKLVLNYTVGLPTQRIEQNISRRPGEVGMAEMIALSQDPDAYADVERLLPPGCTDPAPEGVGE